MLDAGCWCWLVNQRLSRSGARCPHLYRGRGAGLWKSWRLASMID